MSAQQEIRTSVDKSTLQVWDRDVLLRFDRTGRFLALVESGRIIRRGLNHRMLQVTQTSPRGISRRQYHELSSDEKNNLLEHAYRTAFAALSQSGGEVSRRRQWITLLHDWSPALLAEDERQFSYTYRPVHILPPGEYNSLVVQVTEGCSYHRCLFCDFYRDEPFRVKSITQLEEHLSAIKAFFGERLLDKSQVFLGDANAIVVETGRLLQFMELIRGHLGRQSLFSSFMDTFNLEHKSVEDLDSLREAGLTTLYIGLESAHNGLREFLRKPGTAEEALRAIQLAKQAGLRLMIMIMVGVGGTAFAASHLRETKAALANLHLDARDIVALSPFVKPEGAAGQEYDALLEQQESRDLRDEELDAELHHWMVQTKGVTQARVSLYQIREHIY